MRLANHKFRVNINNRDKVSLDGKIKRRHRQIAECQRDIAFFERDAEENNLKLKRDREIMEQTQDELKISRYGKNKAARLIWSTTFEEGIYWERGSK